MSVLTRESRFCYLSLGLQTPGLLLGKLVLYQLSYHRVDRHRLSVAPTLGCVDQGRGFSQWQLTGPSLRAWSSNGDVEEEIRGPFD